MLNAHSNKKSLSWKLGILSKSSEERTTRVSLKWKYSEGSTTDLVKTTPQLGGAKQTPMHIHLADKIFLPVQPMS